MTFELFQRPTPAPYITALTNGHIKLSGLAYTKLGHPKHLHLYYDKKNHLLALVPTPATTNSYLITSGTYGININACDYFKAITGLPAEDTRLTATAADDGSLTVDLAPLTNPTGD